MSATGCGRNCVAATPLQTMPIKDDHENMIMMSSPAQIGKAKRTSNDCQGEPHTLLPHHYRYLSPASSHCARLLITRHQRAASSRITASAAATATGGVMLLLLSLAYSCTQRHVRQCKMSGSN